MPSKANTSVLITSSEPCPVRLFDVRSCRNTLARHYQRNARVPTSVWSSRCNVDIHEIYTRLSWVKQEQSQQNPSGSAQSNLKHYTDIFAQNRYCYCRFLTFRDTTSFRPRRTGAMWLSLGLGWTCAWARRKPFCLLRYACASRERAWV